MVCIVYLQLPRSVMRNFSHPRTCVASVWKISLPPSMQAPGNPGSQCSYTCTCPPPPNAVTKLAPFDVCSAYEPSGWRINLNLDSGHPPYPGATAPLTRPPPLGAESAQPSAGTILGMM